MCKLLTLPVIQSLKLQKAEINEFEFWIDAPSMLQTFHESNQKKKRDTKRGGLFFDYMAVACPIQRKRNVQFDVKSINTSNIVNNNMVG